MRIIKHGTYISVPYALRKLIENYVVDDKLHSQVFEPCNNTEGNVTTIETTCTCSDHYKINDKLCIERDLQFWAGKLGESGLNEWSWVTANNLEVGDFLLTDHSKQERIDKLQYLDVVLEGCALTSDSNFFASGYLVK